MALVHLVARLIRGGYTLLDTQFVTDHLQRFGAVEIPTRAEYRRRLTERWRRRPVSAGLDEDPLAVLQESTHTS